MTPAPLPPVFPFSALAGQPALRLALLLVAIDPGIGGVLVEGPRGTAKSTAARSLAELLPGSAFVPLPLGASLEHLVGTLDLDEALAGHAVRFRPGLLARADGGVLYVDEVNLLPDLLVDALLDAAASGMHVVERDGVSQAHAARFALIGTMNPEEGALRPQLLDRFGLDVALDNLTDPAVREAAVRDRLAFDTDPAAFRTRHGAALRELTGRLAHARQRAPTLDSGDTVFARVTTLCLAARVDGLRADLVLLRAARALAAWEEASAVTPAHVDQVAELVLRHRRHPDAAAESPPAPGETPREDTADDSLWGEMPPEPVGLTAAKPLRPLPGGPAAKKA